MANNLNSGALFDNSNKTSEKAPDYSGVANVAGKEYRVAGWINVPKEGGSQYLSLKFTDDTGERKEGGSGYTPATAAPEKKKMF